MAAAAAAVQEAVRAEAMLATQTEAKAAAGDALREAAMAVAAAGQTGPERREERLVGALAVQKVRMVEKVEAIAVAVQVV